MIFNFNEKKEVVALLGSGSMGMAIAERIASNRTVLLGDISEKALQSAREKLEYSGYSVETMKVDAGNKESVYAFARKAAELGPVMHFINTAGASPHQTNPQHIIDLDLVGSAYSLDAFAEVMSRLMAVQESYPELQASGLYKQTMDSIKEYEENVRMARMIYNDTATRFNRYVRQWPSSMVAGQQHFVVRDYLTTDSKEKKTMPTLFQE